MSEPQNVFNIDEVERAISNAAASYSKILIVAGKSGTGKTSLLSSISKEMGIPFINLGLNLSRLLLNLTARQRKLKVADMMSELLDGYEEPHLTMDNTEIIFEQSLKLNPLGLLKNISRSRLLIWSWNGELEGNHLVYAYLGHPEYQRISAKDFTVISLQN